MTCMSDNKNRGYIGKFEIRVFSRALVFLYSIWFNLLLSGRDSQHAVTYRAIQEVTVYPHLLPGTSA